MFDTNVVLIVESLLRNARESVGDEFVGDLFEGEQLFNKVEVPGLARLIDSVSLGTETTAVVELQHFLGRLVVTQVQQDSDDGRPRPAFSVVAVDGHDPSFHACIEKVLLLR